MYLVFYNIAIYIDSMYDQVCINKMRRKNIFVDEKITSKITDRKQT